MSLRLGVKYVRLAGDIIVTVDHNKEQRTNKTRKRWREGILVKSKEEKERRTERSTKPSTRRIRKRVTHHTTLIAMHDALLWVLALDMLPNGSHHITSHHITSHHIPTLGII